MRRRNRSSCCRTPATGLLECLNVTVNSDDPPFFSTTLTDELRHATRFARLHRSELAQLQRRAARASFAPEELKKSLIAEIDAWAEN